MNILTPIINLFCTTALCLSHQICHHETLTPLELQFAMHTELTSALRSRSSTSANEPSPIPYHQLPDATKAAFAHDLHQFVTAHGGGWERTDPWCYLGYAPVPAPYSLQRTFALSWFATHHATFAELSPVLQRRFVKEALIDATTLYDTAELTAANDHTSDHVHYIANELDYICNAGTIPCIQSK